MPKVNNPTESELEILSILWEKEKASVKEVHEVVYKTKEVGYTTTLKLMQIMNQKGLVTRNVSAKKHIYTAALQKEKAQDQMVHKIIKTFFGGSSTQLILQTLEKNTPTKKELVDIKLVVEKLQAK